MNHAVKGFLDGLKPERTMTVTEWADTYRILSNTASSRPGKYSSSLTPHAREIMDCLSSNHPAQRVVFMAGAQVGKTEIGLNWVGSLMDISPGPAMIVMPTDEAVKRNTATRIDPMIESTERLKQTCAPARSRNAKNTTHEKSFVGGILVMTGANSATGLKSTPIRYLMLDEVDEYPANLDGQGSAIELAVARTKTFANKKIYIASTPTKKGASAIEAEYLLTDQRKRFLPCPYCGELQVLYFDQLRYDDIDGTNTRYECIGCKEHIPEWKKTEMLGNGQWIATAPQNARPDIAGFWINSLYSPYGFYSWADAVKAYHKALKDESGDKMITFVNTVLAQSHEVKGDQPEWEHLFQRRANYPIGQPPADVCFITAGIDIQGNRIEAEILGWGKGRRTWSIEYLTILGNTAESEVWDKLQTALDKTYTSADGREMKILKACIDTGHATTHVYDFTRRYPDGRVVPIKGQDKQKVLISPPRTIDYTSEGQKVKAAVGLVNIGVSIIKSEVYATLALKVKDDGTKPNGWCEWPEYSQEYFKGITAEKLVHSISKGYAVYQWQRIYRANEPLDTRVYNRAAATLLQVDRFTDADYEKLRTMYVKAKAAPARKRVGGVGNFWD